MIGEILAVGTAAIFAVCVLVSRDPGHGYRIEKKPHPAGDWEVTVYQRGKWATVARRSTYESALVWVRERDPSGEYPDHATAGWRYGNNQVGFLQRMK